MMNYKKAGILAYMGIFMLTACKEQPKRFEIIEHPADKRIDIKVDGQDFTSYIYPDGLMKPVLYPLRTSTGTFITRGWPMHPREGERVDHPHHVGLWFNYGDVNGLDFWNNSTAIPAEKRNEYGTIKHDGIHRKEVTDQYALLEVSKYWQNDQGANLLKEETSYRFGAEGDLRTITLTTKLSALDKKVSFTDNKEGLLGIRLARELEHPSNEPVKFTDANGIETEVAKLDNSKTTGKYRSSEGIEGDDVWGTRGRWVNLNGQIAQEAISLVILDHPDNVGYPTYWHARGYGLFAANPLGQKAMSSGKDSLNFSLDPGKSVVFNYKILIQSGKHLTDTTVNTMADAFAKEKP